MHQSKQYLPLQPATPAHADPARAGVSLLLNYICVYLQLGSFVHSAADFWPVYASKMLMPVVVCHRCITISH